MTLTFTLGAGFVLRDEPDAARSILEAVLGCNVAWGIIDGVLLVLARAFDRSRPARLGRALRRAGPAADPVAPIAAELDDVLAPLVDPAARRALYSGIAERVREVRPERLRIPRGDWLAAVGVFWIVFFSSLPAILPFLVFSDPRFAMRVSNLLLLALLFFVGVQWGRVTSSSPLRAATSVTLVGVVLVVIAIAIGG